LNMGKKISNQPGIFRVNWFRKDGNGKFIWPGFGENMRVLKWIVERARGRAEGVQSPFGIMPRHQDITWQGLDFGVDTFYKLMEIDRAAGKAEAADQSGHFEKFGSTLPGEMEHQRGLLIERLDQAPEVWKLEGA
ncbi:MAG: phosphoenolpyruvate carboxykinase (GTP), partial [Rhodospirillales bacterium]|nr:phosphoenolpyruvate carboxykinase (GTP) [Rhodospirillales bacterium]